MQGSVHTETRKDQVALNVILKRLYDCSAGLMTLNPQSPLIANTKQH